MTDFYDEEQEDEGVSRSQLKRERDELRALGRRLLELKPAQRHLSFVGKQMPDQDLDAIRAYLDRLDSSSQAHAQHFHQIERWRDRLLTGSNEDQEAFMSAYPQTDRQQLRQLVRQATKEAAENKPPAASRKIFKLVRETVEQDL